MSEICCLRALYVSCVPFYLASFQMERVVGHCTRHIAPKGHQAGVLPLKIRLPPCSPVYTGNAELSPLSSNYLRFPWPPRLPRLSWSWVDGVGGLSSMYVPSVLHSWRDRQETCCLVSARPWVLGWQITSLFSCHQEWWENL